MSLNVQVETSVSAIITSVMVSLTATITQMRLVVVSTELTQDIWLPEAEQQMPVLPSQITYYPST